MNPIGFAGCHLMHHAKGIRLTVAKGDIPGPACHLLDRCYFFAKERISSSGVNLGAEQLFFVQR